MKKEKLSAEQYLINSAIVHDMCTDWFNLEVKIDPPAKLTEVKLRPWYQLVNGNLLDVENVDSLFTLDNLDNKILSRLSKLYYFAALRVGIDFIEVLHATNDKVSRQFGIKTYRQMSTMYPFIVFLPIFNKIYTDYVLASAEEEASTY